MRALFLLLVIAAGLAGASYAAARFTAGKVVGPNAGLGPPTAQFAFDGVSGLPGQPRAWIMAYPEAERFGRDGAEVYISVTGNLLGTWPEDLEEQLDAQRSVDP
ncbi:MAG TPA: hypothetical protein VFS51_00595 [Gemmatimonadales bacterium]|nr:hypothetical protein [Gemmatimonadales bacterium]